MAVPLWTQHDILILILMQQLQLGVFLHFILLVHVRMRATELSITEHFVEILHHV